MPANTSQRIEEALQLPCARARTPIFPDLASDRASSRLTRRVPRNQWLTLPALTGGIHVASFPSAPRLWNTQNGLHCFVIHTGLIHNGLMQLKTYLQKHGITMASWSVRARSTSG